MEFEAKKPPHRGFTTLCKFSKYSMFSNSLGMAHLHGCAIDKRNACYIPQTACQIAIEREHVRFFEFNKTLVTWAFGKIAA
jgi:hypothetical protein